MVGSIRERHQLTNWKKYFQIRVEPSGDWQKYFIWNSWEAASGETDPTSDEPFIRSLRAPLAKCTPLITCVGRKNGVRNRICSFPIAGLYRALHFLHIFKLICTDKYVAHCSDLILLANPLRPPPLLVRMKLSLEDILVDQTVPVDEASFTVLVFIRFGVPSWTGLLGSGLPLKGKWSEINPGSWVSVQQMSAQVTLQTWMANQQGTKVVPMFIHWKLICLCLCRSTGGKVVVMSIQCKLISNLLPLALTFTWAPLADTDNHDTMQYSVIPCITLHYCIAK